MQDLYIKKSVSLPPPVYEWLRGEAERLGITLSAAIAHLAIENMRKDARLKAK